MVIQLFVKYSALIVAIIYLILFIFHVYIYKKHRYTNQYTLVRGFALLIVSFFYSALFVGYIELSSSVSAQISRLIWITFSLIFFAEAIKDNQLDGN